MKLFVQVLMLINNLNIVSALIIDSVGIRNVVGRSHEVNNYLPHCLNITSLFKFIIISDKLKVLKLNIASTFLKIIII